MTGRPSTYTQDIAAEICALVVEGEILNKICRRDGMPALRTVQGWLRDRPEFAELYDRARHDRTDTWADLLIEIAEDTSKDWIEKRRPDGSSETVFNSEHVQRSKLRIDSLKWLMAKAAPRRYGEHLSVDSRSEVTMREGFDGSALSRKDRDALALLLAKARAGSEKAAQS